MLFGARHPAFMLVAAFLWPSAQSFTAVPVPSVSRQRYGARPTAAVVKAHVERQSASSAPEQVGFSPGVVDAASASRPHAARTAGSFESSLQGAAFGAATGFATASGALAEYIDPDDVGEIVSSELPPMWVPLAIGVVLTVGISLLQGSLGDVMNDEAKLGALSGARAAKQSARDRDMFKKKDPK